MAKALLGHIGGTDPRLLEEARHLEAQVVRLKDENDTLAAALHDGQLMTLDPEHDREPALT